VLQEGAPLASLRAPHHLAPADLDLVRAGAGEAERRGETSGCPRRHQRGIGAEGAAARESFADGLLEPPQYTRPEDYRGARVPAVLLSGDHARIARWRRMQAIWLTWRERPDLLATAPLTDDERRLVERFERGETPEQLDDPAN